MKCVKQTNQLVWSMVILALVFTACSNNVSNEDAFSTDELVEAAKSQAMAEDEIAAAYEYVNDELANFEAKKTGVASSKTNTGSLAASDTFTGTENLPDCAVATRDRAEKIITIDFSDGCEGRDGVVRTGKIIIDFDGQFREPGLTRTVTLENYTVNGNAIEGSMSMTYNGNGDGYTREVNGAQITTNEGTFSFSSVKTVVRTEGASTLRPFDDRYEITGNKEGKTRREIDFMSEITSPLIKKRGSIRCRRNLAAGVVEFTFGNTEAILDYGDGSCDRIATLTVNGETREIVLR